MKGFTNTYLTTQEIFDAITPVTFGNIHGILLVATILMTILSINYIFPFLLTIKEVFKKEKQKKIRKNMITQISLQKEIEEDIEKKL